MAKLEKSILKQQKLFGSVKEKFTKEQSSKIHKIKKNYLFEFNKSYTELFKNKFSEKYQPLYASDDIHLGSTR
jgi:hypothetical protein